MYLQVFKRVLDLLISIPLFVLLLPVFLLLLLLLGLANEGKPLFLQVRPGAGGRLFRIIKFRTMNDKRDASGELLPDAARLTGIGSFIRKTSLDEIPQLLNVIKGDMSLIGPRPLLPMYLPLYNAFQRRRHEVKPGITGWAQVQGRNAISWAKKFEYDVWYVDHVSFSVDLQILWLTLLRVLQGRGVNQGGQATSSYFRGNE